MTEAPASPPLSQRYGRLLSCSLPCPDVSFDTFLAAVAGQPRYYWEKQPPATETGETAFAGAGAAVELLAWGAGRYAKIAQSARELFADAYMDGAGAAPILPRLFGGFSFRSDFTPDNTWSIYAPAFFALPHYQLTRRQGQMWLTINTQIPAEDKPASLIPDLRAALRAKIVQLQARQDSAAQTQSALRSIEYPLDRARWQGMLEQATARIRAGALQKVVLARAAELRFAGSVKLLPVLRQLAVHYAACYRFLFEPRPQYAFYGASPELLAAARGRQLKTMALAGSRGRGTCPAEDEALGASLLGSAKDREEHQIVVDKLRESLRPLCASLSIGPADLLKLRNIQHLHSPIHAVLRRELGILPLVEALHPTPALGGEPRGAALQLIRELEPIPRGWYGAPVGFIDARLDGQFAVAIRSAVAQGRRAWIYAGAGIVADSQPQAEWEETTLKFQPMLSAHAGI